MQILTARVVAAAQMLKNVDVTLELDGKYRLKKLCGV